MPLEIEVPDLGVLEFPDDTPEDEIRSAIDSHIASLAKPAPEPAVEKPVSVLPEQTFNIGRDVEAAKAARVGPPVFGKTDYELKPGAELENVTQYPVMPMINVPGITYTPALQQPGAQAPFEAPAPVALPGVEEDLFKPVIDIMPENPAFASAVVQKFSDPSLTNEEKLKRIQRVEGVSDSVRSTVNFFASPAGVSMLGIGAMPKIAQQIAATGFAIDMGSKVPKIARELGEELGKPEGERNERKIADLIATGITTTGFSAMAGAHGVAPAIQAPLAFFGKPTKGIVPSPELQSEFATRPGRVDELAPTPFQRVQGAEITRGYPTLREVDAMAGREAKPAPGEVVPGATLTTQTTPGMTPIESAKDIVGKFRESAINPDVKISNNDSVSVGKSVNTVSDLDAILDLHDQLTKATDAVPSEKTIQNLEKKVALASRAQIVKEAVDIATNTGSWVEGGNTQLGARPLDWKTSPEVAEWLKKNAAKLGIELPDELKAAAPSETAKPSGEEMVKVYHGEGGTGGAGLGGFSVSESHKYASTFGPRQSVVEVPRSVLEKMKQDARNRGEPTNLILPEEYQKKLKPVEKPIEQEVYDTEFIEKPSPTQPLEMSVSDAESNGFTKVAYRGVSKSNPFNKTGTVWLTTSKDVAEAYAKETFGYEDAGVIEVRVNTKDIPVSDIRKLTQDQLNSLKPDEFGNPQKVGIYEHSDDSVLGSSYPHTAIHVPADRVVVVNKPKGTLIESKPSPVPPPTTSIEPAKPAAAPATAAEVSPTAPVSTTAPEAVIPAEVPPVAPPKPPTIPGPIPTLEAPVLSATGLKNAVGDMERLVYGFKERSLAERQVMAEAWIRAGDVLAKNPEAGRELAQALINNPRRGLTGDESALLLRHKVGLENRVNKLAKSTLTAKDEAKVEAQFQFQKARDELRGFLDAVAARGSEWGREGRWRQAMAYEDYTFATQARLLEAAKGGPLTEPEKVTLQNQLKDLQEKTADLENLTKNRDQKLIDEAVTEALDKIEKQGGVRVEYAPRVIEAAEKFAKFMDNQAEAAVARIRESQKRTSAFIVPTFLADYVIIGAAKITRGMVDFARWSSEMLKDFPELKPYLKEVWDKATTEIDTQLTKMESTIAKPIVKKVREKIAATATAAKGKVSKTPQENIADTVQKAAKKFAENDLSSISPMVRSLARFLVESGVRGRENLIDAVHRELQTVIPELTRSDAMRMISGYGEYRTLPTDAVSVLLRGYKGEMQQIAKLEDMAKGEAPKKSGQERRTPTDEERRLIKHVNESKKGGGFSLGSAKTAVRNQIKDLNIEIAKKERILKKQNILTPDKELLDLRAQRDELRKAHKAIFGERQLTDAQKVAMYEKLLDRQIEAVNEQLASGAIFPSKTPPKPPITSPGIEARRQRLAELKLERYYQRESIQPSVVPEMQQANKIAGQMRAVKKRLAGQIEDLERQLAARERTIRSEEHLQYDEQANNLKARRDELRKQYDEMFPPEEMTDMERLAVWKTRTQRRISEISEMVRSGNIERKVRKPVKLDEEANELQAKVDKVKDDLKHAREMAEWKAMSVFDKGKLGAWNTYDAARTLMTTGEFSFLLRQGKLATLSHPILAAKALPSMFRAMKSWEAAHAQDLKILKDPEYAAARAAKLHIMDESSSLNKMEEFYAARWAHKIPVVSHFNRAARVFLNKLRYDTWKAMRKSMSKGGEPTAIEDAAIAQFVNEATGRGSLGWAEQGAVPLGRTFFAPRYAVSRFQILTGHSMWKQNGRARATIAREYARMLVGLGLYYTMLNAAFTILSPDKKKPITFDARSTDFGKIRVGDTRIDPLAGLAQAATMIGRTATGQTKTQKGRIIQLRKLAGEPRKYGEPTWTDVAARFARSKAHPALGAIANLFDGTSMDGSDTTVVKETGNLMGPITWLDIYKALQEQDLPTATTMSLLALLGEGLQNYEKKK